MSKHQRKIPRQTAWTRFQPAQRITEPDGTVGQMWQNNRYVVIVSPVPPLPAGAGVSDGPPLPPLVHLSIRRQDREAVRDWRDLQRIKNALVGPECEGVELFPAESRLVDTANQAHLWVVADPAVRFPFGYSQRLVAEGPYSDNAVQRPFPPDARPRDVKTEADLDRMLQEKKEEKEERGHGGSNIWTRCVERHSRTMARQAHTLISC